MKSRGEQHQELCGVRAVAKLGRQVQLVSLAQLCRDQRRVLAVRLMPLPAAAAAARVRGGDMVEQHGQAGEQQSQLDEAG